LDVADDQAMKVRCGGERGILVSKEGAVWVDYVADLGDGFNSTYAVAYLLGQREVDVEGQKLPRADCLVMGGDQVYPDASRDDYWKRMQRPYEAAFPRSNKTDAQRPPVYLIPGNHDWYDGLTLFLAKFCRGRDTHLGSWIARQNRSYFAFQLRDNWWVWGYDSQLGEDIDKPQADYFTSVARQMRPGAKIIICASIPSWLAAEVSTKDPAEREKFYRGLDYIAGILRNECEDAKVPLVLSGDLHHYSRYVALESGTTFITAGGGGAFLHPTHNLPEKISASWVNTRQTLQVGKTGDTQTGTDACYPDRRASRRLAFGNWKFAYLNWDFCATLGAIYWISALLLLAWDGYGQSGGAGDFWDRVASQIGAFTPTPVFVTVAAAYLAVIVNYADIRSKWKKMICGAAHALVHLMILVLSTAIVSVASYPLLSLPLGQIFYMFGLGVGMVVAGFVGGIVWGFYLLLVSYALGDHANDAFSAMRLDSYRHFLRLKIDGDRLVVHPIGIDRSPTRGEWRKNDAFVEDDQNTPFFVPRRPLGQRLIEPPVEIDAANIKPLRHIAGS
jgi:3',5'-cyclic AMP phosphodiesterase CpdA